MEAIQITRRQILSGQIDGLSQDDLPLFRAVFALGLHNLDMNVKRDTLRDRNEDFWHKVQLNIADITGRTAPFNKPVVFGEYSKSGEFEFNVGTILTFYNLHVKKHYNFYGRPVVEKPSRVDPHFAQELAVGNARDNGERYIAASIMFPTGRD